VQASPPGGEVRVEAIELAHHQLPPQAEHLSRGAIMLRITDQGRGIPDSIKERLFEPFVTTKSGGSGLGLSIVHRAVEAHHGFILVDTPDQKGGTRFTVILPKLGSDVAKSTPRRTRRVSKKVDT
jgi:two-component system sensor histidine kinase PilS (NtrC family)